MYVCVRVCACWGVGVGVGGGGYSKDCIKLRVYMVLRSCGGLNPRFRQGTLPSLNIDIRLIDIWKQYFGDDTWSFLENDMKISFFKGRSSGFPNLTEQYMLLLIRAILISVSHTIQKWRFLTMHMRHRNSIARPQTKPLPLPPPSGPTWIRMAPWPLKSKGRQGYILNSTCDIELIDMRQGFKIKWHTTGLFLKVDMRHGHK